MDRQTVIDRLRAHQAELVGRGFQHIFLFGSVARGEALALSDVDLAVEMHGAATADLSYFDAIERLREIVGRRIDVVRLPARNKDLAREIERDRVNAF